MKFLNRGKTSKYLKYAFGEIVLVVIGILIALSINNWNENRKNQLKESLLLNNIKEDLEIDANQITKSLNELNDQLNITDKTLKRSSDATIQLDYDSIGLLRYSSDFRPITQKNHAEAVSNLENEDIRDLIQTYFLKEEQVGDIFQEYEKIIHEYLRPYFRKVGMHDIRSLYHEKTEKLVRVLLHPKIVEEQLPNTDFQQLLFERRLKTGSFHLLLSELLSENRKLVEIISSRR